MEEAKKKQMGGRKAPTEWNKLVKKMYAEGKMGNPNYKLGQAMQAAKQIYRKSTKSEMNNSMARSKRRSVRSQKAKSRRNRYSSSTRRTMTI